MTIEQVLGLVKDELQAVEREMAQNMLSEISMIPTVSRYLISSGGKRFRPMLLILCARLCGYNGQKTIPLASTIEFIHTATLLHDDVVDRAFVRRGLASANYVWGDGASVLVGDFLFTKSFSLIVKEGNLRILEVISAATTRMAEGEVMQLVKMGNPYISEEDYFYVITNKTAVLISAACQIGAILATSTPATEKALKDFGLNLGIAFQLVDDILDYSAEAETLGKGIGQDLNEGKVTLPLIYILKTSPPREREKIVQIIQDKNRLPADIAYLWRLIHEGGGLTYTIKIAENYVHRAKNLISSFPPSPEKEALLTLADYTVKRKK